MNNRLLIALPLAAVLAIPALAQTTSSTQSQPAARSAMIHHVFSVFLSQIRIRF